MTVEILIAVIAALPPTLAAILAFVSSRSVKRSVGNSPGVPLTEVIQRLGDKVDGLSEGQSLVRERLARLEGRWERRSRRHP